MSLSPETSSTPDPAALPADPAAYRRRKSDGRLLGPFWWGLMIGAMLCVIAGIAVVKVLPGLLAKPPPAAATPAAQPTPEPATPAAPVSETAAPPPAAEGAPPPGQVQALSSRLDRIEAGQRKTVQAAGAALATASLVQAAQSSRPFSGELAEVSMLLPESPDVAALRRVATTGAPTRAGLASAFPDAAAKASVAARAPQGDGLTARIARALAGVVTIRRTSEVKGNGADAVLGRAEADMQESDLESALKEIARLSPRARNALEAWRSQAQARVDIDRHVAAIRADAVRNLSVTMASNP